MSRLVVCAPAGVVHGAHRQRLVCRHSRVSEEMCGAPMQLVARGSRVPARTAGRSPVIFSIAHARYTRARVVSTVCSVPKSRIMVGRSDLTLVSYGSGAAAESCPIIGHFSRNFERAPPAPRRGRRGGARTRHLLSAHSTQQRPPAAPARCCPSPPCSRHHACSPLDFCYWTFVTASRRRTERGSMCINDSPAEPCP